MIRISCCTPHSYDAHSGTLVHGFDCDQAGHALTKSEQAQWKAQITHHPAVARMEPLPVPKEGRKVFRRVCAGYQHTCPWRGCHNCLGLDD